MCKQTGAQVRGDLGGGGGEVRVSVGGSTTYGQTHGQRLQR